MMPEQFIAHGIAVIPVAPRSKMPLVRWRKYQRLLPTDTEQRRWFQSGRLINYAVICGWRGLTVLDFDSTAPYRAWLAWAVIEGGVARQVAVETYRVRTPRGMHVYVFVDETPRCGKFQYGDIKGKGGYVLIPPSIHPSGVPYVAVDDAAPILSVTSLDEIAPGAPPVAAPSLPPMVYVYPTSSLWPATVVEEIKARVPILSFFPDAKQTGRDWHVARCPFHDDRHPSLWIDTARGLCHCYAGCFEKPADVIDLYARFRGVSVKEAIADLANSL